MFILHFNINCMNFLAFSGLDSIRISINYIPANFRHFAILIYWNIL